jgi:hypothetical protein
VRIRHIQLSLILMLLCLGGAAVGHAQLWSGILSPSRATDWSQAGVPGGIPSGSWSQCGPTIAAYGSSGSFQSPSTIVNAMNHTSSGYTGCGANTYVLLGPGDFYLNGAIAPLKLNSEELRGSGPTQTRLHWSAGSTCNYGLNTCLIGFESSDSTYAGSNPTSYSWTGGYAQGATSITLSLSGSQSITAGQTLLVLDQCDTGYTGASCAGSAVDNGNFFNCEDGYNPSNQTGCTFNGPDGSAARPHRFQEEVVQVTGCSPSCSASGSVTVTVYPGLAHANWSSGQSPAAWLIQPQTNVGIKNLLVDGSNTTYSGTTTGPSFYNTWGGWVQNVAMLGLPNMTLYGFQTSHLQIESNYIYNSGQSSATTDNAGINYYGSGNLVVNNICHNCHLPIIQGNSSSGNVVAYNYTINTYTGNEILFGSLWPGHSNGSDYNLYEGNVSAMYDTDQTHGTQLMNTLYRNFLTGWESCANGNCGTAKKKTDDLVAVLDLSYNRYHNFIGNVLGTPGVHTAGYNYTNAEYYFSKGGVGYPWSFGSGNNGVSKSQGYQGGPIPVDPLVASTAMRWGNWDAFNGATQWNTNEVPTGISVYPNSAPTNCTNGGSCPPSFYTATRPSWWSSSIPFPAIGPDVSNGNVGQCTGTLNTPGQYAGVAATSSSQCTGTSLASAWGGHLNAIPAMACYLSLGGPPDGTGNALPFDATKCYGSSTSTPKQTPGTPTGLTGTVVQ